MLGDAGDTDLGQTLEKLLVRWGRQTRWAPQHALSSNGSGPVTMGTRTEPEGLGGENRSRLRQFSEQKWTLEHLLVYLYRKPALEASWGVGPRAQPCPLEPLTWVGPRPRPEGLPSGERSRPGYNPAWSGPRQRDRAGGGVAHSTLSPVTKAQREAGTCLTSRGTRGLLTLESANCARQMCRDT